MIEVVEPVAKICAGVEVVLVVQRGALNVTGELLFLRAQSRVLQDFGRLVAKQKGIAEHRAEEFSG